MNLKQGLWEAVLSLVFSVVMLLSVGGGQYMTEKDILPGKKESLLCNA